VACLYKDPEKRTITITLFFIRIFEAVINNPVVTAYVDLIYSIDNNCEIDFVYKILFESFEVI
jgi:hypothetical protein